MRRVRSLPALALPLLGACALQSMPLEGRDSETFFTGVRATWRVGETPPPAAEGGRVETLVDVEVAYSASDFTQALASGASVAVGDTLFVGPGTLEVEHDLWRVEADARLRLTSAAGLGLDLLLGLGFNRLGLDVDDGSTRTSDSLNSLGPLIGAGLFYDAGARVRLFAEGRVVGGLSDGAEFSELEVADLGVELRLSALTSLLLGWRYQQYESEENATFDSEYELTSSGPFLTLGISFWPLQAGRGRAVLRFCKGRLALNAPSSGRR